MTTTIDDTVVSYEMHLSTDGFGDFLRRTSKRPLLRPDEEADLAKQIEVGVYAEHLLLTGSKVKKEYLKELAAAGVRAQHTFVESNVRLVVSLSRRFAGRGVPMQDCVQEGFLGLHRAMHKFDYTMGIKFSTYATLWIEQAVSLNISSVRAVHLPRAVEALVNKIGAINSAMKNELGRNPTIAELSARAEVDEETVIYHLGLDKWEFSLDAVMSTDEGMSLIEVVPDENASAMLTEMEEDYDHNLIREGLMRASDGLSARQRAVFRYRMGWETGSPMTGPEIGKRLGIQRWHIRDCDEFTRGFMRNFVLHDVDFREQVADRIAASKEHSK